MAPWSLAVLAARPPWLGPAPRRAAGPGCLRPSPLAWLLLWARLLVPLPTVVDRSTFPLAGPLPGRYRPIGTVLFAGIARSAARSGTLGGWLRSRRG